MGEWVDGSKAVGKQRAIAQSDGRRSATSGHQQDHEQEQEQEQDQEQLSTTLTMTANVKQCASSTRLHHPTTHSPTAPPTSPIKCSVAISLLLSVHPSISLSVSFFSSTTTTTTHVQLPQCAAETKDLPHAALWVAALATLLLQGLKGLLGSTKGGKPQINDITYLHKKKDTSLCNLEKDFNDFQDN